MKFFETKYLEALIQVSDTGFIPIIWLIDHFELFKSTITWPESLPPIPRSNLIVGSFRERFHLTYLDILSEAGMELDNETKDFIIII